jgi:hypothetical protein
VSHDYKVLDSTGRHDYSEHFERINCVCDGEGCDTILYALFTWDLRSPVARDHAAVFKGLSNVQRVILEVGEPPESSDHVEVWLRGRQDPLEVQQRFATSTDPSSKKQAFVDALGDRRIADALLVLCGETNIASLVRGSDEFNDPYGFAEQLGDMNVRLVLNPGHDYMRRPEMRQKRRYYSLGGRTVVSVWNRGRGREADWPWTVFHDRTERTDDVTKLQPFADRSDIRIGVLDLQTL